MPKLGETEITIPTYEKYWIYDHEQGHDIVISSETGKITIKCRWPDKKRDASGRVHGQKLLHKLEDLR